MTNSRVGRFCHALALCAALAGCAMSPRGGELCSFSGAAQSARPGAVIVNLYALGEGLPELAAQQVLQQGGEWRLAAAPGRYLALAFQDEAGDQQWSGGESWGEAGGGEPLVCAGGRPLRGLDIDLGSRQPGGEVRKMLQESRPGPLALPQGRALSVGEVGRMDDPLWTSEYGQQGIWHPDLFMRQAHPGIYFLHPYQEGKIPVLFIHGMGGTPRNFDTLVQGLDVSRFQPWLAFYPSGSDLTVSAQMLHVVLLQLQRRFHFPSLVVVAHSMGGLVARQLLLDMAVDRPAVTVPLLLTLATPWAGDGGAGVGVRRTPAPWVVDSWRNLAPDSAFLRQLFVRADGSPKTLPAATRHVLLFGFQRGRWMSREPGDGRVALSSQLRDEAQSQAFRIKGYQQSHAGILHADEVSRDVSAALASYALPAAGQPDGGRRPPMLRR
ncbi:hypothetical protein AWB61_09360 [Chromobacterium sp. F49]|uniref:esterase/lipase family protein n=1 Tax=Chromobacterium TaxID=535 RepID=UPI00068E03D3|nr:MULTISPECIES: alpha/beta hydrolase [Chromobacterium]KUM02606.1 hypothetical protein Cv017_02525 [Chromobacterium subtsugae]KZE87992.1 hypothetical protein AWB61_09360 [Chromobacterium sp. F49]MBW7565492.1 alpha/beta hydrolase [Chromobacterium subtsugae]WSE90861.1 alpha/beta hydrolase [Chromobacterium subtsugae]WVH59234.1 alpha/beta hydrolase [Chromobacterium subtsugae]